MVSVEFVLTFASHGMHEIGLPSLTATISLAVLSSTLERFHGYRRTSSSILKSNQKTAVKFDESDENDLIFGNSE